MVRRTTRTLAIAAVLLLAFPAVASAYNARTDGTLTSSTEALDVRVEFANRFEEVQPDRIHVSLADTDEEIRGDCVAGCEAQLSGGSSTFRVPVTVRGSALGDLPTRYPNGDITFSVVGSRVDSFGRRVRFAVDEVTTTIDVPGSAVTGLQATTVDREVRLSWARAPEVGISGYKVERITGSQTRQVTTTTGTSATDRPGPGEHRYRVTTQRPRAGGSGTHETVSTTVTATVEPEPEPETPAEGTDGSNDAGPSDGEARSGGDRSSTGGARSSGSQNVGGSSDTAVAEQAEEPSTAAPSQARQRRAPRTAPLPNVSTGRGGLSIPELPRVGDIFRGELDFGQGEDGEGDGRSGDGDEVVLSAPAGGVGGFLGGGEDAERIAIPIAGGLLLTAIGLHLWRWLKVPLA